jgi:hypothetical protein
MNGSGAAAFNLLLSVFRMSTDQILAVHFQPEPENTFRLSPHPARHDHHSWHLAQPLPRPAQHLSLRFPLDSGEQLAGKQAPTQLGRALEELGIHQMPAYLPQAEGRIERVWRTFQDRLVSELRLARATILPQANAVLARFCQDYNQFARPARPTRLATSAPCPAALVSPAA